MGAASHIPHHLPAGSAVANLSLLGYDPDKYFTGRAPLEAAAQGIELGPEDWAIRCNLVTVENQVMTNFTAPRGRLISSLQMVGRPICSKVRSWLGIRRSAIAMSPRWRKTATRKLARALSASRPKVEAVDRKKPPARISRSYRVAGAA